MGITVPHLSELMHTVRVILYNFVLSGIAIALAYTAFLLDRFIPFRLTEDLAIVGWSLLLVGGTIILWAVVHLLRYSGASGAPGDPTTKLVTSGPYSYTRNPIYAGDGLIILGLAFITGSPSMVVYFGLFVLAINGYVHYVEEPATERRFGEAYGIYKRDVPRWIPQIRR